MNNQKFKGTTVDANPASVQSIVTRLPVYGPRSHWFLMAACNHHENGQFARKSDQFRFNRGDHFIDLHGPEIVFYWYKNAGNKQRVRVSRWGFPCVGYIQWYGNWCWDSTKVTDETMVAICCRLKQRGFRPESASVEMEEWFESLERGPVLLPTGSRRKTLNPSRSVNNRLFGVSADDQKRLFED